MSSHSCCHSRGIHDDGVKLLLFHSSHRLGGIQPSKVIQGTKLVEKQKIIRNIILEPRKHKRYMLKILIPFQI